MNDIYQNDLEALLASGLDFKKMTGKNILVTGATGLIGYNLITLLMGVSEKLDLNLGIYAHVRNVEKAEKLFGDTCQEIHFVKGDIRKPIELEEKIDYIVHAASQTSSKGFVSAPIETIRVALDGTMNILDFANEKQVESLVYLSTMEVYGTPGTDEKIAEDHGTDLDTMVVRSCYPESKRLCENLLASYCQEYGLSGKVLRLTQTFGPGVQYQDGRVFADFARCAIEGRDIILHTKGETRRNYLYTADAVSAILTVLLNGEKGQAYNAANEETYCSIYEMAELVARECADASISVKIVLEDISKFGYAPVLHMNLDTSKLQALGWKAEKKLDEMFKILIVSMKETKETD